MRAEGAQAAASIDGRAANMQQASKSAPCSMPPDILPPACPAPRRTSAVCEEGMPPEETSRVKSHLRSV